MDRAEILAKVRQIDVETVKEQSRFTDDLGADSLDNVELIMDIEEAFDIEIPDAEAGACATVKDVVDLVDKRVGS